jgi:hypothetical protein
MTIETNKWGGQTLRHTTRYEIQVHNRILHLQKSWRCSYNQVVNKVLKDKLGIV